MARCCLSSLLPSSLGCRGPTERSALLFASVAEAVSLPYPPSDLSHPNPARLVAAAWGDALARTLGAMQQQQQAQQVSKQTIDRSEGVMEYVGTS